ncbi:MAG: hypothetical protein NZ528_01525 [Caldilineales bacterium]|nr:hypothetical protein [Caldilineales bacterium]MDW8318663.1 hypothetical protein [Anaerolineae bacterium]
MPFFEDTGPRPEEERSPIWRAVAHIGERPEQMVALNLLWTLQAAPLLLAWAFPAWPLPLRLALSLYTAVALIPVGAALLELLAAVGRGQPVGREDLGPALRRHAWRSLRVFVPLFTLVAGLLGLTVWADGRELTALGVATRLALLWLGVLSVHWGGAYLEGCEAWGVLAVSARRFWQRPGLTLAAALVAALALLLGLASVGGFFLIVPVFLGLLQVELARPFQVAV